MAVDSLIYWLDMSPPAGALDERLMHRFAGFSFEEYDVLKEWLIYMCEHAPNLGTRTSGPGDTYARVFQTIDSLQQETQLRNMIEQEQTGEGGA